jgi:dipeptidyl aminopeptidase/acylaminoacyl peptidase
VPPPSRVSAGEPGWGWDELLPSFIRAEDSRKVPANPALPRLGLWLYRSAQASTVSPVDLNEGIMRIGPSLPRVLAVICVGGLAAGVSPALGAFPGENGKIAFDSDRDGDIDIWTMSPRGGNLDNLTANSDAFDGLSSWRADGRKLAFMSDRETPTNPTPPGFSVPDTEIFVMNADGSNQRQLTFNAFDDEFPAWSPDGKRIVSTRDFDPIIGQLDEDILTMDSDGTNEKNLTNTPGVNEFEPVWSPTGPDHRLWQRPRRRRGDLHDATERIGSAAAHVQRSHRRVPGLVARRQADRLPRRA